MEASRGVGQADGKPRVAPYPASCGICESSSEAMLHLTIKLREFRTIENWKKAMPPSISKGLFGRLLFEKFLISKRVLGQIMYYNND